MLPESIELVVVTPERQLLRETVVEVTIPGQGGELGVLPGHAPLMTELGIGELTLPHGHFEPGDSDCGYSADSRKCYRTASRCWRKRRSVPKRLM